MSKQIEYSCFSPQQMKLFGEENLSASDITGIRLHAGNCPLCAEVLNTLVPGNISAILSINERVNSRIAQMVDTVPANPFYKNYRILVALLALLIVGAGFVFYSELFPGNGKNNASLVIAKKNNASDNQNADKIIDSEEKDIVLIEDEKQKEESSTIIIETQKSENTIDNPNVEKDLSDTKTNQEENATNVRSTTYSPDKTINKTSASNFVSKIEVQLINVVSAATPGSRETGKNGQLSGGKIRHGNYKIADMPQYPGGEAMLKSYLTNKIWDNVDDRDNLLGESLVLYFDVTSRGKIENPDVYGKITPEVKEQILKIIGNIPRWIAGKGKGSITCTLSVSFK